MLTFCGTPNCRRTLRSTSGALCGTCRNSTTFGTIGPITSRSRAGNATARVLPPALAIPTTSGKTAPDFGQLYSEHYGKLYYWILGKARHSADAEDICGSAFAKAFESYADLKDPALFKTWVFTIAYNEMKRRWRKAGIRKEEPLEGHEERPEPLDFTHELEAWIECKNALAALEMLNAIHRRAIQDALRGWSLQQTAHRRKIPLGTALSRLDTARKELRALCAA